jgi:hypothetical protein
MNTEVDIERAIEMNVIDSKNNPTRREDYQTVRRFLLLKGKPSRPIEIFYRDHQRTSRRSEHFSQIGSLIHLTNC